jgi:hypothetical protein
VTGSNRLGMGSSAGGYGCYYPVSQMPMPPARGWGVGSATTDPAGRRAGGPMKYQIVTGRIGLADHVFPPKK